MQLFIVEGVKGLNPSHPLLSVRYRIRTLDRCHGTCPVHRRGLFISLCCYFLHFLFQLNLLSRVEKLIAYIGKATSGS